MIKTENNKQKIINDFIATDDGIEIIAKNASVTILDSQQKDKTTPIGACYSMQNEYLKKDGIVTLDL